VLANLLLAAGVTRETVLETVPKGRTTGCPAMLLAKE